MAYTVDAIKFCSTISSVFLGKKGKSDQLWLKDLDNDREVELAQTADFINQYFTNLAKRYNTNKEYLGKESV